MGVPLNRSLSTSTNGARVAEILAPAPRFNDSPTTSFGSVSEASGYSNTVADGPDGFVISYTNGGGAAANLCIGIAANFATPTGLTLVAPTTVSGSTPAAFEDMLRSRELLVNGLQITSTSGPVQFPRLFRYAVEQGNGDINLKTVQLFLYQRNTSQDPNMMTLRFGSPFLLKYNRAFIWDVLNGQTVTIGLLLGASTNQ